jgi:hypothetical protein
VVLVVGRGVHRALYWLREPPYGSSVPSARVEAVPLPATEADRGDAGSAFAADEHARGMAAGSSPGGQGDDD